MKRYAAVDLGASGGRVIVGQIGDGTLTLDEVHRFPNEPVRLPDGLHWDVMRLYRDTITGLGKVDDVTSIGIDAWAVDYGLIDERGGLLGLPYHYRDARADGLPRADAYAVTGIQHLPFNTINQLRVEPADRLNAARAMLLMPDLIGYLLTGAMGAERTNASTTALYDATARNWSTRLCQELHLPARILPPLREPGDPIGRTQGWTGLDLDVVAVASHDTASAVLAVPARTPRFAYISTGTWSLVGVELDTPVLTEASRVANFTNEAGVDGTIRYLRNVMGLWLLQECQRAWRDNDIGGLVEAAGHVPAFGAVVDPDDPAFLAPGDMPGRIVAYAQRTGQRPPLGRAEMTRCILESLALGHRAALRDAVRLSGHDVDVVHLVGGGARNALLCQLTADACERVVVAGPIEATAVGNVLSQARVNGGPTDRAEARAVVAASTPLVSYEPRGDAAAWAKAAALIGRQ